MERPIVMFHMVFAVIWCFLINPFVLSSILRILLDQYLEI
jgi:hypothetical protein